MFLMSELFPPWLYEDSWTSVRRPAGYSRHDRPPAVKSDGEMKDLFSINDEHRPLYFAVQRDMLRLDAQRALLPFLTFGALLLFGSRRTRLKVITGSLSLIVGGFFVTIWLLLVAGF